MIDLSLLQSILFWFVCWVLLEYILSEILLQYFFLGFFFLLFFSLQNSFQKKRLYEFHCFSYHNVNCGHPILDYYSIILLNAVY